jgi:hypothetical protein
MSKCCQRISKKDNVACWYIITPPSLAIEINPVSESGSPTKKRGVVIRSSSELEEITKLLSNPKLPQLAKSIDEINPESKRPKITDRSDVFEI